MQAGTWMAFCHPSKLAGDRVTSEVKMPLWLRSWWLGETPGAPAGEVLRICEALGGRLGWAKPAQGRGLLWGEGEGWQDAHRPRVGTADSTRSCWRGHWARLGFLPWRRPRSSSRQHTGIESSTQLTALIICAPHSSLLPAATGAFPEGILHGVQIVSLRRAPSPSTRQHRPNVL